jgi:hypothetical protein
MDATKALSRQHCTQGCRGEGEILPVRCSFDCPSVGPPPIEVCVPQSIYLCTWSIGTKVFVRIFDFPCHILSYPVISCHILSYHIISYHIIIDHVTSRHIISYHTISKIYIPSDKSSVHPPTRDLGIRRPGHRLNPAPYSSTRQCPR